MDWTGITNSADESERLGIGLGRSLQGGDLVLLSGDLGAGKSIVARGIARALGVTAWRGSPTFNIVHEYPTKPRLIHADFYRLTEAEVTDLGLEENFGDATVMVTEWPERAGAFLRTLSATRVLNVDIAIIDADTRGIRVGNWERAELSTMRDQ